MLTSDRFKPKIKKKNYNIPFKGGPAFYLDVLRVQSSIPHRVHPAAHLRVHPQRAFLHIPRRNTRHRRKNSSDDPGSI